MRGGAHLACGAAPPLVLRGCFSLSAAADKSLFARRDACVDERRDSEGRSRTALGFFLRPRPGKIGRGRAACVNIAVTACKTCR
ncbi:hypothetical protein MRX96_015258 [Rhipicephalus microplus]